MSTAQTLARPRQDAVCCPQCGSTQKIRLGALARGREFAGKPLEPPWPGETLYRCIGCMLAYRYPLKPANVYESMYESASTQVWSANSIRIDHRLIADRIAAHAESGSVLDIGCYDGGLLGALGPRYQKFGIEASRAAAQAAAARGVVMLASRISQLQTIPRKFDVVCAIDVVEHVADPLALLWSIRSKLADDGIIIISSGNVDAPACDALGSSYWYCSAPEHISFISMRWATIAATKLGLKIVDSATFRHSNPGPTFRLKHGLKLGLKLVAGLMELAFVRPFSTRSRALGPRFVLGVPGLFEDRLLLVFAKAASGRSR